MSDVLRVTQLTCSRLCHDLVGVAGAVNAGLEILAEMGGLDDSALDLATKSGIEMTRRLAFYRVAFGAGGTGGNGGDMAGLRKLADEFLSGGNVTLDWAVGETAPAEISPVMGKLLLNLVLIASECLPRGGRVAVNAATFEGGMGIAVEATGTGAGLREDLALAMTPGRDVETLDSRSIHGLITQLLVIEAGCELEVAADDGAVRFAAVVV